MIVGFLTLLELGWEDQPRVGHRAEGGREGGRERGREGGREGEREGERGGGRERGREGGREGDSKRANTLNSVTFLHSCSHSPFLMAPSLACHSPP